MKMNDEQLRKAIASLRASVMGDRKIDLEETRILLDFARPLAKDNAEMADFVALLEDVRADGVITEDESERLELRLDWLEREVVAAAPDTGFLGRLFRLNRNRTTVRTEIVAGVTTFMTMAYILAVNPNILSQAGIPRGGEPHTGAAAREQPRDSPVIER